jgi:hypothetical protein
LVQVGYVRVVDLDIGASESDIWAIRVVTISERAGSLQPRVGLDTAMENVRRLVAKEQPKVGVQVPLSLPNFYDFARLPSIVSDPLRSVAAPRERERENSSHNLRRKFEVQARDGSHIGRYGMRERLR